MEWIEVRIETTSKAVEHVCAMLIGAGINGVQIEDTEDMKNFLKTNPNQWDYIDERLLNSSDKNCFVTFYVSNNLYGLEYISSVKHGIHRLKSMQMEIDFGTLNLQLINVNDEDWLNSWKKYYKPFEVGNKIVIKPIWEEYSNENKIVFNIEPGHVFGTGLHKTTQLCIIQLEKYIDKNKTQNILDLGCGSGILSIISLLLGADYAFAVDIDENAVDIAMQNAKLNNINKYNYKVKFGNILEDKELQLEILQTKYDIVVANIVADVIISFSGFVKEAAKRGGLFISSGIIKDRLDEVYAKLEKEGFVILETFCEEDWVCIVSKYS